MSTSGIPSSGIPSPGTSGGGPRPRTAQRLSSARERVLRAVAGLAGEFLDNWVTLEAVAHHLGGHPNTSRQQLSALVEAGMVEVASFPTGRPGRRPQGFRITARGRAALTDHDQSDEYRDLVGAFATYLVQQDGETASTHARAVGEIWGSQQAAHLSPTGSTPAKEPIDGLVEVLDMLGFSPSRRATADGEALTLSTCPLLDLALQHPGVICEMHEGMVDAVLHTLGSQEGVRLLPMADPEGCRIEMHRRS